MRLPLGGLLLLGGVALLLGGHSDSSSSHSLQYFLTRVSEPSPGLPKFFALGYVDNHLTDYYDSNTRRSVPRVPWLEEVEKDYPQFWNRKSGRLLHIELTLGANLELTKNCLNQSHDGK
uniref:Uncharacterized protein n=1 Tax=Sphaerodactylus townsendi TaxID=933632 RepID=A0ACB8EF51_9SAUR